MKKYEYIEEVKNCIIDYIKENYDEGAEIHTDILYDQLFIADSVTGNASGSFYCDSYKAYEALNEAREELDGKYDF